MRYKYLLHWLLFKKLFIVHSVNFHYNCWSETINFHCPKNRMFTVDGNIHLALSAIYMLRVSTQAKLGMKLFVVTNNLGPLV